MKIQTYKDSIKSEAETKQFFINPFLDAMGYCHTDPSFVQVEVAISFAKNEIKADYVLCSKDKKPTILLEAKHYKENLENHFSQLSGYFYNLRSKYAIEFGILTNGIEYRFYIDLDKDNLLDKEPFLIINLEKLTSKDFEYLKKFYRNSLNTEEVRLFALEKKYTDKLLAYLKKERKNISNDFLDFFKTKIGFKETYSNEICKNIIKNTFNMFDEKSDTLVNNTKNNKKFTKDSINSNNIETENLKIFEKLNFNMKSIYQNLESFIFDLNPNEIKKAETKWYTAFKVNNRCFVDFSFKANKINITVTLNQITLKEGFIRDVSSIGKLGNGNIQIFCTGSSNIKEIKDLIKQSYNNIFSKYRKID
ncbi:type I restriction endonuclease [Borreliella mayonii]|uniref:type I restriction endonuclease n=1 Tax=Borreliella mayonii TaxID=1674146 RepID=UPI001F3EEC76|nr:type I restriction enzyme HsdR N-terminal domain-containing protein [Borreliella mayonii]